MATSHPFAGPEPDNIPLTLAPLVRTIAQVKFPLLTQFSVNGDAVASGVASSLSAQYPLLEVGQEVSVIITAEGASEQLGPTKMWRLVSADRAWQITFTGSFLSIDTTRYVRRSDFAKRLTDAWDVLNQQVAVPYIERLGVRYINQITDPEHLSRLPQLLRPEVLGATMTQEQSEVVLTSVMTEAQYRFPDESALTARWGLLPRGTTIESASPPFDYATWMLDTDSFREFMPGARDGRDLYEDVRALAGRGYQFFRWAMSDLSPFGAQQ